MRSVEVGSAAPAIQVVSKVSVQIGIWLQDTFPELSERRKLVGSVRKVRGQPLPIGTEDLPCESFVHHVEEVTQVRFDLLSIEAVRRYLDSDMGVVAERLLDERATALADGLTPLHD